MALVFKTPEKAEKLATKRTTKRAANQSGRKRTVKAKRAASA